MKLLFCLILCSDLLIAQSVETKKDPAFVKMIDDLPAKEPFDSIQSYKRYTKENYLYVISDKDVYELFGWNLSSRYRSFDFLKYHILGKKICRQCEQHCRHDEGVTACHRNVCVKEWVWLKRNNKKAFTDIPFTRKPALSPAEDSIIKRMYDDTIIVSNKDANKATWITHSGGDCYATFKFNIVKDNYYPSLLLIERNIYGGCRAGGFWQFAIDFKIPPGILQTSKNVILVEKEDVGNGTN